MTTELSAANTGDLKKSFHIKMAMVNVLRKKFPGVDFSVHVNEDTFSANVMWFDRKISFDVVYEAFEKYGDISENLSGTILTDVESAKARCDAITEAVGKPIVGYKEYDFQSDTNPEKEPVVGAEFIDVSKLYEIDQISAFMNDDPWGDGW